MNRFTNAPLPSLRFLVNAIYKNIKSHESFIRFWKLENHLTLCLSRSAWSMQLIAKYKLLKSRKSLLNILVPSYFCNSSLAPLREIETNLFFYPIKESGEPDIREIEKICSEHKIDIVIAVHFFGNFIDFSDLSRISQNFNIWFIEDFAHLLNLPKGKPIKSDFQLFSPHKFFALPDGAILSVNKRIFKKNNEIEEFEEIYQTFVRGKYSKLRPYLWLLKRVIQKLNIGIKLGISDFYNDTLVNTSKDFLKPGMSPFSKGLLSKMDEDINENIRVRQKNADSWKKVIFSRYPSAEVIFNKYTPESIYLLGIQFPSEQDLKDALHWCNEKNFPVCTWPDLPDEVLEEKEYFKNSIYLRYKCIFFHVHSSIDKNHIESSV